MPAPSTPTDWRSYWDKRYRRQPSCYDEGANGFVSALLGDTAPSRILDAACGQGRNAVWLARQGHAVTAVDLSGVAIDQAKQLAERNEVNVEFVLADLLEWAPEGDGFDLVLLSYLQLPVEARRVAHQRVVGLLVPGGSVFLIAHHADNLDHGTGGPDQREVLYRESDLSEDFSDLEVVRNESVEREVNREDVAGTAIDLLFIGRRPESG